MSVNAPFALFPISFDIPEQYAKMIPSDIPKEAIRGVAVGQSSLLNMGLRNKIEYYFGSASKLHIIHGQKYRDVILFINEKALGNYVFSQTKLDI